MCVCVCVCVCVCSYICLKLIYNSSSAAGVLQALAISPRSPVPYSSCLMRYGKTVADESPAPPLTPKT